MVLAQWEFVLNTWNTGSAFMKKTIFNLIFQNPLQNSQHEVVAVIKGEIGPTAAEFKKTLSKNKKVIIDITYASWFTKVDTDTNISRYLNCVISSD